ncbi:hypothetical protein OH768_33470 [Streptomyces sp. NBC_01622]|nr:hypothetical protein OH768_33470 [Streptomyces sp. NBC_01622]
MSRSQPNSSTRLRGPRPVSQARRIMSGAEEILDPLAAPADESPAQDTR